MSSVEQLYSLRPPAVGAERPMGLTFTPTSPMASAVGAMAMSAGVMDTPSGLQTRARFVCQQLQIICTRGGAAATA